MSLSLKNITSQRPCETLDARNICQKKTTHKSVYLDHNEIMNTEDIVSQLRELRPIITARYKTSELGIFGSFIRGEQSASSDIDILAEFEDGADLFDLIGLTLYLEDIFQRKVDVVPKRALRLELRESVFREVVPI